MGRRRSSNHDLPPRMHREGGQFYYVTGTRPRKWIPLGADVNEVRRQWAILEGEAEDPSDRTFAAGARMGLHERAEPLRRHQGTPRDGPRPLRQRR